MGKFGLANKFIELLMGCICESSFSMLVNGLLQASSSRWWASTKAIPCHCIYLYWVPNCYQGLSSENKLEVDSWVSLLAMQRNTLPIFLYAGDCFHGGSTRMREASVMAAVLHEYCLLSGQNINIGKSHIIFGAGFLDRIVVVVVMCSSTEYSHHQENATNVRSSIVQ